MSLSTIHEIWNLIRPSIETGDVREAAELMVNYLVDHDFDTKEIKTMFKRDSDIQQALSFFVETSVNDLSAHDEDDEEDELTFDYDDDEEDEDY